MPKVIQNISKYKTLNLAFLAIVLFFIITTFFVTSASATGFDYNVYVRSALNISVSSDTVSMLLNPATQPFDTADLSVTVGTNNPYGYKLYVNSDTTNLSNRTIADTYINTLSDSATESNFPANSWGYQISSGSTGDPAITSTTNFYPFLSNTLISSSNIATNEQITTLTFASKVNYGKPSGVYSIDLNFKALPTVTTYDMQNLNPDICTENPTIVTDSRDGQSYTIAKLEDGNCWMLDNLRLDLTSERVQSILSHTNTNASDEAINYLINGGGGGSGAEQYARTAVSSTWTSDSQNSYVSPYVVISGNKDGGGTWDRNTLVTNFGSASGEVGAYYNYCAATAGAYCYASNTGSSSVEYDICPVGWKIPTGGENGEYQALCGEYKGSDCTQPDSTEAALATRDALGIVFSGHFVSGLAYDQSLRANLWSSSVDPNGTNAYSLYVNADSIHIHAASGRHRGLSVRCMLPISNS